MPTPTALASAAIRSCVGPTNCAAELGDVPAPEVRVQRSPADAVAGFEHDDGAPGGYEPPRGGQAGKPGADDGDVGAARTAAPARGRGGGGVCVEREQRGAGGGAPDELAAGEVPVDHGAAPYARSASARAADPRRAPPLPFRRVSPRIELEPDEVAGLIRGSRLLELRADTPPGRPQALHRHGADRDGTRSAGWPSAAGPTRCGTCSSW